MLKKGSSLSIIHHISNNDKAEESFSWERQLDIIAQILSKLLKLLPGTPL